MKKVILLGAVVLSLASCGKDYECVCTSEFSDGSTFTQTETFRNSTLDNAKSKCGAKAFDIEAENKTLGWESTVKHSVYVK